MTKSSGLVAAAVLAAMPPAALAAAHAQRGEGRFQVAGAGGSLHASSSAHTEFRLPSGSWKQVHGAMAGTVAYGSYRRAVRVDGSSCVLGLAANGRAQSHRPPLRRFAHTRVLSHGVDGRLHWLVGLAGGSPEPVLYATAYEPAPRWATAKPYVYYEMTVSVGERAPHICGRLRDRTDLAASIRSARVLRGGLVS